MGEGEVCLAVFNREQVGNENSFKTESNRGRDWMVGNAESVEVPGKKQMKEASNDDVCSEVVNPAASPRENASSYQTNTSEVAELVTSNQAGCGEISSTCSGNSSSDSLHGEKGCQNKASAPSTSHVTLELPKHSSTSGIRKITFKFSERKNDQPSASFAQPGCNFDDDGPFSRGFDGGAGSSENHLRASDMELKMSEKVSPNGYPSSVKKLLLTGILEGAKVKYISDSPEKELCGIIRGSGYLCGCSACNFSKVVTAYEFELHAGGRTRHPNNHIYLENGRPIYSVVHVLRTAPLSDLDEVIRDMVGSSLNEDAFNTWRASFQKNCVMKADKKHNYSSGFPYSLLSTPYQAMEDMISPSSYYVGESILLEPRSYMGNPEAYKHVLKKPGSCLPKSITHRKRTAEGSIKKRDNDLHRLLFLPNGLPDGAELAYYAKGQRVLGGFKQGNGIFCNHCNCKVSPSQFEAHAGWAVRRQPYRHIYTSNGLALHDIAISLASGQSLTTGDSDDMCTLCGDGGDLIICHGCPRAFHPACLDLQSAPEGNWHCSYCSDKFVPDSGSGAFESTRPNMIRQTRVVKTPESEPGGCVICGSQDFTPAIFHERTVIICDQCEREYHVACLRDTGRCDLKELPSEEWFCADDCRSIHLALRSMVSSGIEMIPASVSNKIRDKMVDRGLIEAGSEAQWRIISGKNRLPEDLPFLSRATAIFRECFDPIAAIAGRDLIPVMVYGRNISGQEFGGMYCIVLIVKCVVVSACLLRVFGGDAAELPLVATCRENQGKGYFQALFSCVEGLLSCLNVRTLVLPAADEGKSIWTVKFGFRKMGEDRLKRFMKEFRPTVFKGTSMLEKQVPPSTGC